MRCRLFRLFLRQIGSSCFTLRLYPSISLRQQGCGAFLRSMANKSIFLCKLRRQSNFGLLRCCQPGCCCRLLHRHSRRLPRFFLGKTPRFFRLRQLRFFLGQQDRFPLRRR